MSSEVVIPMASRKSGFRSNARQHQLAEKMQLHMGVNPKIGFFLPPPKSSHFNGVFDYKPSILVVFPLFLETPTWALRSSCLMFYAMFFWGQNDQQVQEFHRYQKVMHIKICSLRSTHIIYAWYIYLHFVDFCGKCR